MSASLHLARPENLQAVLRLAASFHEGAGIQTDDAAREAALVPLLEGNPYGAIYLIGPTRAPIGYVVVTFGWSVELGGMDSFVDEIFIRPAVRGRGIATEVLGKLATTLKSAGIKALHLEVDRENDAAQRLYSRARFRARDRYMLMTRML